ncbi:MAG: alpha-2-macroglobulin family protein, partial [Chitinophagaceae bacterium]
MRNRILLSLLFGAALLFTACKRNSVQLTSTTADGEVPRQGNLTFQFSKALVADSLLNNWDSTEYVRFEPAIRGRFRWEAPDRLIFSPEGNLAPATDYRARITNEVLRWSRFNDVQKGDGIRFHTPLLQLNDAQVTWVLPDGNGSSALPQVALDFNYPVKASELRDKLKLQVDGKDAPWELVTASSSSTMLLRLTGFKSEDRDYEANLQIDGGLLPEGGRSASPDPMKAQLTIPSPYVLNINNVESEHDGTEGLVRIYTSQQLQPQALTSLIRFEPAVRYTAEYTDYGIALRSEQFTPENSYSLVVARGLRGRIGGVLKEESNNQVVFGALEPDIHFTSNKALYLSKRGSGNIEVRITNLPKVKLVISKIYENNILQVRRHGYSPRNADVDGSAQAASYREDSEDGEEGYEEASAMGGDVIYSQEIDTRSLPKSGHGRLLNLAQFRDRLPDFRGIYHVEIRSSSEYWESDSRLISFSEIGLIARQGGDRLYVFANSIKTANALGGVTVSAYGSNNQLLGTGTTNSDGVLELKLARREFSGFRPALLIARTADDMNYLPFSGTRVGTSRFDVGGKRLSVAGLDAFIWAERDIYRPGETVHFAMLLRDRAWKSPGELPLKYKFLFPNGKEFRNGLKSLNEGGMAEGAIELPTSAITGSYTLELYSSNDVLLATQTFNVEEFVPDRIKVSAKLDKSGYRPGEVAALAINAVNFFGPPAANRNYELEVQVRGATFRPKGFGEYDFSLSEAGNIHDKEVKEGRTDASGNASESFTIPALYNEHGLLQASFFATVFDETGRPVARKAVADIFTQPVFFGLQDDGYSYYTLNQPATFNLAAVSQDGGAVAASALVRVIKHEYKTVLTKSGDYFRYESQEQDKILHDAPLTLRGKGVFTFVPRTPGSYELRVYRPGADAYVSKKFYSYGAWGGDNSSFEVNNEGQVTIELDKDSYKTGQRARVLFKAPFSGRMLVTVERDGVLSYRYLDVTQRSASMDLKLEAAHVPNVYITATLFKPHEVSDIPLTVAHGFRSVAVEEPGRHMDVRIEASKTSRSNRRQTVRVKAAPGSYVTLAAVDNGVLQITDFKTPDPYGYYYQKRALEVQGYDLYPLLFPELRARLSSTGGDGGNDMNKRVNPMPAKRVKILSYWSGIRRTDGSGWADFTFDVPQFSGQVRLMALTAIGDRFGSAESTMQVADPVVLSTALPRFLSPGDTAYVPLTITNTTSRSSTGTASLQVSGPLQVAGAASQSLTLAPNSEARVQFRVVATTLGVGKVTSRVEALGETFTEAIEISARPPSTLQQRSGSGSVTGGARQRIDIPEADFLQGSSNYQLLVSRSPVVELADQLRWLIQYPYGCTEQTVSSAF